MGYRAKHCKKRAGLRRTSCRAGTIFRQDPSNKQLLQHGMVTNSVSVGGFKALSPDSIALDDGLYEVLLVYPVDNPMELQWLINDLLTHNTESTRFLYFRTSHITFDSEEEISWTLDGEFGGSETHAEIKNYARAIRFVTAGENADGNS